MPSSPEPSSEAGPLPSFLQHRIRGFSPWLSCLIIPHNATDDVSTRPRAHRTITRQIETNMRGNPSCRAVRRLPVSPSLSCAGPGRRAFRTDAAPRRVCLTSACRTYGLETRSSRWLLLQPGHINMRSLATAAEAKTSAAVGGPIPEYDRRVETGMLKNDEHQRGRGKLYTMAVQAGPDMCSRHYSKPTESL